MGSYRPCQGRWNEAVPTSKKALELDPHNLSNLRQLALSYVFMRRFAEAAALWTAPSRWPPKMLNCEHIEPRLISIGGPIRSLCTSYFRDYDVRKSSRGPTRGEFWLDLALCERDPVLAERALVTIGDGFNQNQLFFS